MTSSSQQVQIEMSSGDVQEASTASVLGANRMRDILSAPIPLGYKPPRSAQPPVSSAGRLRAALRWTALALVAAAACFGLGIGIAPLVHPGFKSSASNSNDTGAGGVYAAAARGSGDHVSFLVVGDWGRRGAYNQTAVANAMGACGTVSKPDFVVSVGDNFYEGGLNALDDVEFEQSFTDVYTHASLQVPWHAVLGNHDYGDCGYDDDKGELACPLAADASRSPAFQLDPALRTRDWRWRAGRSFDHRPTADTHLFFVDTNPHISSYTTKSWATSVPGGLSSQDAGAGKTALGAALAASDARWKLVFGHHPMRSNGFWADVRDVREALEVTVAKGGAAAYFNGHDHDMQHTSVDLDVGGDGGKERLHHFTSGAGSKTGRRFGVAETLFEHDGAGFASVRVSRGAVKVQFWGAVGEGSEGLLYSTKVEHPSGVFYRD
jgi:tartrate-resistant acid phosphatase type 5